MEKIAVDYRVTNALMGRDFRLTGTGAQLLVQDCFGILMARNHTAAFDLMRESRMWIISEFSMSFHSAMPFWGDRVTVELWLSSEPAVKVYVDYRILHNGTEVCRGDCVWAILDIVTRRPVPALPLLEGLVCGDAVQSGVHRHPLQEPVAERFRSVYRTQASDADFNNHVSNITYLKLCLGTLPFEYVDSRSLVALDMKFVHETFPGQELVCSVSTSASDDNWICTVHNGDGELCCRAGLVYSERFTESDDYGNLEIRKR